MSASSLTLCFDGHCPICAADMARLNRWNRSGHLNFVDIPTPAFDPAPLGVTMADLERELHGQTASGKILVGIDSMLAAYTLVGKGWRVVPLHVVSPRPLLAVLYRIFAQPLPSFALDGLPTGLAGEDEVCSASNRILKH